VRGLQQGGGEVLSSGGEVYDVKGGGFRGW
jgi:hypothetical protein